MHRILTAALAALAVLGATPLHAQQPETAAQSVSHGLTWTFDPVHRVMQAAPSANYAIRGKPDPGAVGEASPATTTYTGTFVINVTVRLISILPAETTLSCSGGIGMSYSIEPKTTTSSGFIQIAHQSSSENVAATTSGSTATCRFTFPYSWTVPVATSSTTVTVDQISGSVGIVAQTPEYINGENQSIVVRSVTVDLLGPATIPADGTKTTLTASTVL